MQLSEDRFLAFCKDVTARKRAEEDLRNLTARLVDVREEERSAIARVRWSGIELDAISYHSLAGSGFKAGKGVAYRGLLETLSARERPMLLGLDANTPKVDHPDESRSVFWWPVHEPLVLGPRGQANAQAEIEITMAPPDPSMIQMGNLTIKIGAVLDPRRSGQVQMSQ